jgi:hypothetical protein
LDRRRKPPVRAFNGLTLADDGMRHAFRIGYDHRLSAGADHAVLGMDLIYGGRADWGDLALLKALDKAAPPIVGISFPLAAEDAPEYPPGALERCLPGHVVLAV